MSYSTWFKLSLLGVLVLLGAGCAKAVTDKTDDVSFSAIDAERPGSTTMVKAECTAEISTTIYQDPAKLPVFDGYRHMKTLGPIFTAVECGEGRVERLLGNELGDDSLNVVFVVYPKIGAPDALRDALVEAGLICTDAWREAGCYNPQSRDNRASRLYRLASLADQIEKEELERMNDPQ